VIWSVHELDATLLNLDKRVSGPTAYPVHKRLPGKGGVERIYVMGHPGGGALAVSLHDSHLLDYEDPRIHYRTPTAEGSSGSPIFDSQWRLIGVHHAGSWKMPRLNGQVGTYEANEGIWIEAIRRRLEQMLGN
jgi:V8-like Glu-specific endopeptidase